MSCICACTSLRRFSPSYPVSFCTGELYLSKGRKNGFSKAGFPSKGFESCRYDSRPWKGLDESRRDPRQVSKRFELYRYDLIENQSLKNQFYSLWANGVSEQIVPRISPPNGEAVMLELCWIVFGHFEIVFGSFSDRFGSFPDPCGPFSDCFG